MKTVFIKLKSALKYTVIGVIALVLIVGAIIGIFIFKNDAPILSGSVEYDIKYKGDLKLDLYRPTKNVFETSPVVFYVHGGAWIRGTKAGINFNRVNGAINTLRDQGYTVICPDYSLAGKGKGAFPDCILDVYEAIDWTKNNASQYDLDTTNLGLLGESAGAHIAMMIAFSETTIDPEKYNKTDFSYLVDIYGPSDLAGIYHGQMIDKITASINKVTNVFGTEVNIKEYIFGFDPLQDTVKANQMLHDFSPINNLKGTKFPVLIIHGKSDQIVPVQQSIALKSELDKLGVTNEMHLMDSVDHNFRNASREQKDSTQTWISDFVIRSYRK